MKRIFALLLVVCMVFTLVACGKQEEPAPTDPTEPTEFRHTFDLEIRHNYFEILKRYGKTTNAKEYLNIPTYSEKAMFSGGAYIVPGSDASAELSDRLKHMPSAMEHFYISNVLPVLPAELRVREGCSSYAVYDTDTGYRVYVYFIPKYNGGIVAGYPIILNKNAPLLSHYSFTNIQVGDPIEEVEEIDDITKFHKNSFASWEPTVFETNKTRGNPAASVHYLSDGIMRITYTKTEDGKIVVDDIYYARDYKIPSISDDEIDYVIYSMDLPQK